MGTRGSVEQRNKYPFVGIRWEKKGSCLRGTWHVSPSNLITCLVVCVFLFSFLVFICCSSEKNLTFVKHPRCADSLVPYTMTGGNGILNNPPWPVKWWRVLWKISKYACVLLSDNRGGKIRTTIWFRVAHPFEVWLDLKSPCYLWFICCLGSHIHKKEC